MIFENQDIGGHRRTRKDIKGHEKTPLRKFETVLLICIQLWNVLSVYMKL